MKKYPSNRFLLILLILSIGLAPISCGSDDTDPVLTEDRMPDPTNASTTIVATSPVFIDGIATSAVTVTLADTNGNRFTNSGGTVILSSTGSASISTLTDNGNGTYSVTITNTAAETVTISGTLGGIAISDTAEITFDSSSDPTNSTIEASSPVIADGMATATVTVTLFDTNGDPFMTSGGTVVLNPTGTAIISEVTDNSNGTYSATVTNTTAEAVTISGTLNGTAITDTAAIAFDAKQSTEPVGPTIIKINCGGMEVTIGDQTFQEDQYFEGPTIAFTNPNVTDIADTDLDEVFLTERISDNENFPGPFSYNIPLSNGTYTVKLYFAEVYWGVQNPQNLDGGIGSRVFDIDMEDMPIFTDFDLFKEVGAERAITKMYDIEVTDGELNIVFEASVDKPKISALEIFGAGAIIP